jgi:DHA2 family multidrug resistance protein-like MFS transporter
MGMSEAFVNPVASPASTKAGRREWLGLAVIALPCLLYSMDLTVMNLALPALSRALKPSSAELLWIVDIYGFLLAGSLITMGMLGDRIGRRRLLLIGAAAFEVASVLAAFSTNATMLIVARGLLGIAGATLAPSTLSLIRNMFLEPRERTFAIGIWTTSFSVGAAIGPLAGGLLLERFWWGSVFLIGAPVMLLLLLLGPFLLPEFRCRSAGRIDWPSAALSALGILPIIYGIKRAALGGFGFASALWLLGGVVMGVIFIRRQRSLSEPLLDVGLFRIPSFGISLATNTLTLFVTFGSFLFIAQYLQQVLGLSPLVAGLCTIPSAGGFVAGSMLAPQLVKRFQPASVVAFGLFVSAGGLLLLTRVEASSALALVVCASVLLALGTSPAVTLATDLILTSAPADRAGAICALSETSSELGGALGIAILGTVGAAIFRWRMSGLGSTLGVGQAARDTLNGALAVSAQLPPSSAASLALHARAAFSEGMHVAALIGLVITLASAALVLTCLGPREPEQKASSAVFCALTRCASKSAKATSII